LAKEARAHRGDSDATNGSGFDEVFTGPGFHDSGD
jgi:hypothetical protein